MYIYVVSMIFQYLFGAIWIVTTYVSRYEGSVDSFYRHCSIIENTRAEVIDPFRENAKGNEFIGNA